MYLDPGAWGAVVQVLVGALLAIPVLIGIYWGRIKVFFSKRKGRYEVGDEEDK